MKLEFIKPYGGTLVPASDAVSEQMTKFKSGGLYTIEIQRQRNPKFHAKVFAFFNFCFEHWCGSLAGLENMDLPAQFDVFRKHLTVLAGYYDQFYTIDGNIIIEARSLSYGNMEQDEFEQCYSALINAAIRTVFNNTQDEWMLNRLQGFF